MIDEYMLPDGRLPLRIEGRSAVYQKARGTGEVRYPLSLIRYRRSRSQNMTALERSAAARMRAALLLAKNPNYFHEIGTLGGKSSKRGKQKHGRTNKRNPQSQGNAAGEAHSGTLPVLEDR